MTLDVDGLLSPICDEFPGGDPLAYSRGLRSQLSELRNPARSSNPDDPDRDGRTEPIDWKAITDLAESALRSTTKDLRVACHLTEAAMHHWGLPELRTGLTLLRRLRAASHGGHSEGCFARGSQLTFVLNEDNDDAVGVFLFGSVLQRFLGLASGINSFVETVIETKQRDGMLAHFEPHAGEEPRL